jgi:4-hydroxy-tetrahydrodipicolinate synthase
MEEIKNIVALITPFNEDGSIDYSGLESHLNFLKNSKPDGLFVNSTTGEFTSLSLKEKMDVASFVLENAKDIPVYMNVNSTVFSETVELCKFAKEKHFYAIVSPPPYFLVPSSNGIIDYFKEISELSQLPTFIYNIPQATGYSIPVEVVKTIVEEAPLVKGIKVTYDNMNYYIRLVNEVKIFREDFMIFTGSEQLYVPLLLTGGNGGVMALGNIALNLFHEAKDAFNSKNFDKLSLLHKKISRLTYIYSLSSSFGYAIKISLGYMGIPVKPYVRKPLLNDTFNEELFKTIRKEVGLI